MTAAELTNSSNARGFVRDSVVHVRSPAVYASNHATPVPVVGYLY